MSKVFDARSVPCPSARLSFSPREGRAKAIVLALCLFAASGFGALAQDYEPDVLELRDGTGYEFDWDPAFDMSRGGTIEFWTMPFFEEDPGYEPFILSSAGELGASYAVVMTVDRDGIVLIAGEEQGVVAHDFTDDRPHHIAISVFTDGIRIFIDGEVKGDFDFVLPELPAAALFVGSANGERAPYRGMVAQLRFWDTNVVPEYLDEFRIKPTLSEDGDHPDIAFLKAESDFSEESMLIVEEVTPNE